MPGPEPPNYSLRRPGRSVLDLFDRNSDFVDENGSDRIAPNYSLRRPGRSVLDLFDRPAAKIRMNSENAGGKGGGKRPPRYELLACSRHTKDNLARKGRLVDPVWAFLVPAKHAACLAKSRNHPVFNDQDQFTHSQTSGQDPRYTSGCCLPRSSHKQLRKCTSPSPINTFLHQTATCYLSGSSQFTQMHKLQTHSNMLPPKIKSSQVQSGILTQVRLGEKTNESYGTLLLQSQSPTIKHYINSLMT
ncbi:unnamed protein product [Miscanthus lutarioriparius]|uniref:Uncharacterized protein n=1 Tax=Miscanthus lutarioriparius TaxID=422564 RepID=A0A811RH96_9POAL|nr:unnamed protein product [Miscanthus lutarioriparius]